MKNKSWIIVLLRTTLLPMGAVILFYFLLNQISTVSHRYFLVWPVLIAEVVIPTLYLLLLGTFCTGWFARWPYKIRFDILTIAVHGILLWMMWSGSLTAFHLKANVCDSSLFSITLGVYLLDICLQNKNKTDGGTSI